MNLQSIKQAIDSNIEERAKRHLILCIIANDKNAIPEILEMLNNERNQYSELISDQNVELSRALLVLEDANLKHSKKICVDPKWVASEIRKHYEKWSDIVKCTFRI